MTENRPAEAGEQLPEVIGEPVLPERNEIFSEEDQRILKEFIAEFLRTLSIDEIMNALNTLILKACQRVSDA